jgi:hypothetical protein
MPFSLMRRDGDVVVVRERDGKVLGRHKDRKKALRQLRVLFSLGEGVFWWRQVCGWSLCRRTALEKS